MSSSEQETGKVATEAPAVCQKDVKEGVKVSRKGTISAACLCGHRVFTLDPLLTEKECKMFIAMGEERGFKKSSVSGGGHGRTGNEDPVTSSYAVLDDFDTATLLWNRCKAFIPPTVDHLAKNPHFAPKQGWKPHSVCPRLRLYRYGPGDSFPEHIDYKTRKTDVLEDGTRVVYQSVYTMLIYLNEEFEGGKTGYWPDHAGIHCRFLRKEEQQHDSVKAHQVSVTPTTGLDVLQDQNILHEGLPVKQGTKYILRTDVIFERHITRSARLAHLPKDKPEEGVWARLFETSCKNYAI